MRLKFLTILIIFSSKCFSYGTFSRSIFIDDFGGYQFSDEIVEILKQARKKKFNQIKFNITEAFYSNNDSTHIMVYSPSVGGNSPSITKFRFDFTSDSTVTVYKEYNHGSTCYKCAYYLKLIMGIYCISGTFPAINNDFSENCEDLNVDYNAHETGQLLKYTSGDTIIVKRTFPDRAETYYFDKNEKLIKIDWGGDITEYSKPSLDTVISKITQGYSQTTIERKSVSKMITSKFLYSEIQTTNSSYSYISIKTGNAVSRESGKSKIIQEFELNNWELPEKIIVKESNDPMNKVKGSFMDVSYK